MKYQLNQKLGDIMNLDFSHKPNYFLFAQLLVRFIETQSKQQNMSQLNISFEQLEQIFQGDSAATTINLEGILNIADEYQVETLTGDQKLISNYQINSEQSQLQLELNPAAVEAVIQGKALISPDATLHQ